jgi:hypothetical protein
MSRKNPRCPNENWRDHSSTLKKSEQAAKGYFLYFMMATMKLHEAQNENYQFP